jgi:hypothetical protein
MLNHTKRRTENQGLMLSYYLFEFRAAAIELPLVYDLLVLKTELYDQYQIEIPHIVWENRPFLRIRYQVYNQPEDVARLLEALRILLPRYRCS